MVFITDVINKTPNLSVIAEIAALLSLNVIKSKKNFSPLLLLFNSTGHRFEKALQTFPDKHLVRQE
jgi:hypothetical protein